MKYLIGFIFMPWFSLTGFGQASLDTNTSQLQQIYKESGFPAFAVALVDGDKVLYQHSFGFANTEKGLPFTDSTILNLGSVSKTFIGMAILKAVEDGLLSLDADINAYLPFKVIHPKFPDVPIKVRHLASHTSGIIDREAVYKKVYSNEPHDATALESFLQAYLVKGGKHYHSKNFSQYKSGESVEYSNIGAALAALVVEGATKTPFHIYTQKHFFSPLHMSATSWFLKDVPLEKHATLYSETNKVVPLYSLITYPDGGLRSTLNDMIKYMQEAIRGYEGRGMLLTHDSYKQLFKPQFTPASTPLNIDPKEPNTGIFWFYRKSGEVGHTGSDPGVTIIFFFNPATSKGRIFITNTDLERKSKVAAFSKIWSLLERIE